MQLLKSIKPIFVATDVDELSAPNQSGKFIKGVRYSGGKNANLNTGTGTDIPGGNNLQVLSAVPSTTPACSFPELPGVSQTIGGGEFPEVNKIFYLRYNSTGLHGLFMVDGTTLECVTVMIDPVWNFSIDPQHKVPEHRMSLRVLYTSEEGKARRVKEMYLVFTDGNNWQRWINVLASVRTQGFNATLFPYWTLKQPHYDRREFIEYPTRAPWFCPTFTEVPVTLADYRKKNNLLDKSVQLAYAYLLTDGRMTTLSPWSLPFALTKSSCNINGTNLTRCLDYTFYAGSALVEKIFVYRRFCGGDWTLYDTISKFDNCGVNDPSVIGDDYWLRQNPWKDYSYNPTDNTIVYRYCGDKECALVSPEDTLRFQNDIPIVSVAHTPVGDASLFANNKYFYDPVSCNALKNIKITVKEGEAEACTVKTVKISVYSYMSRFTETPCFAYTNGSDKLVRFGGVTINSDGTVQIAEEESNIFGLNFGDRQGPLMYLRGTPYISVGKQYKINADGTKEFIGIIDIGVASQRDLVSDIFRSGGTIIMQHDFFVPAGRYIATLANHAVSLEADYQKTSTYIHGIGRTILRPFEANNMGEETLVNRNKEIEINACDGDVDLYRGSGPDFLYVFVPKDYESGDNRRWRFIEGYVYESNEEKIGVELLNYEPTNGEDIYKKTGTFTDHNGFFYAFTARGAAQEANVAFRGNWNCAITGAELFQTSGLPGRTTGYYKTNVIVSDRFGGEFPACNRIVVRGKISSCDTGIGLSGVAVTLTRGMTTFTASDGTFVLIAHNDRVPVRQDRFYFNASGACIFVDCNCQCIPVINYTDVNVPCVVCNEREYPTEVNVSLRTVVTDQKALKGGARYGVGIVEYDIAMRGTLVGFIDHAQVPTFMERGNFVPTVLGWELLGPLGLKPTTAYVSFFRTKNLNFESYLQWVGDKIEYLNSSGDVTGGVAGAVRARVTIQSLNEFNIDNNFSTTTKYQFVEGDMLRIYDNGDGVMFDPDITDGFLDYQILGTNWNETEQSEDGKSFIIPFDSRLQSLKEKCGFWIELLRPKVCQDKEVYCEICGTYPVINGEIAGGVTSGVLNTWDTYYQSRFFRIEGCVGKTFNHPFESSSVSDFFGTNCDSCGRQSVRDDTVIQRWYPDDIIKSDDFVNEGGFNGLGTFREKNRKQFKGQQGGGIVAMHAERKIIYCIGQNDWFTLDYDMNVVRITEAGIAVANLSQSLSDQNQKVGSNYGCAFSDTATIQFFDGLAIWADAANKGIIISDYRNATNIAEVDNKQYITDKFKFITEFNGSLSETNYLPYLYEMVFGIDVEARELYCTFRPRRNHTSRLDSFVNELREIHIPHQETFVFHLDQKKWMRWAHFTPELYVSTRNFRNGSAMMMFANGQPHYFDANSSNDWNTYFGIKCEMVVEVIYSEDSNKNKIGQSAVIESNNMLWFVDRVMTEEQNSLSYIPPAYMKRKENIWYSEFLADMNSYPNPDPAQLFRRMLIDGKRVYGQSLRIRLVADTSRLGEYCELNNLWVRTAASEKSGK